MPSSESNRYDQPGRLAQRAQREALLAAFAADADTHNIADAHFVADRDYVERQLREVPLPDGFMDRARGVMADAYDPALDYVLRAVELPRGYVDRLRQASG